MKKYLLMLLLGFYYPTCFSQIYGVGNGDGQAIYCVLWDFGAVVLPVNLVSFDASCSDSKTKLVWSTRSDLNNYYFTIERSGDGIIFQSISNNYTKETSNGMQYFSFIDSGAPAGKNYYRLKQTRNDVEFSYSRIVLTNCKTKNLPGISLYPNPTAGLINIQTTMPKTMLFVWNSLGQQVLSSPANQGVTTIDLGQFPQGIYYIEIRTADKSTYHKIVLNRN